MRSCNAFLPHQAEFLLQEARLKDPHAVSPILLMNASFTTTSWTVIIDAASSQVAESRPAFQALCLRYWEPLYAYARGMGKNHHDAEDVTQAFFAHIVATNLPGRTSQGRGRFRWFLLASFRNFIVGEHRAATTQKRGGLNGEAVSLEQCDDASHPPVDGDSPEAAYDRKWAHTLIRLALDKLAEEQNAAGHAERFAALRPLLLDPVRGEAAQSGIGTRLGMSEGNIRTSLSRLRARFRDIVRHEVSLIVADPAETDDEIAHLLRSLH